MPIKIKKVDCSAKDYSETINILSAKIAALELDGDSLTEDQKPAFETVKKAYQERLDTFLEKQKPYDNREQIVDATPEEEAELLANSKTEDEIVESAIATAVSKKWPDNGTLALDIVLRGKEVVDAERAQIAAETEAKVREIEAKARGE